MHWRRARRILGDLKKSVELSSGVRRGRLAFGTRRSQASGLVSGAHVVWGRWKSQVYLSPHVEKPLNSKVIKSFVRELRSHQVFFVFWDSYVLCIYVMNILCTFHISVSRVWYTTPFPGLLHFTLDTYRILLSVKQGGIKYHFKSLWYDSTWDWNQVSRQNNCSNEWWLVL